MLGSYWWWMRHSELVLLLLKVVLLLLHTRHHHLLIRARPRGKVRLTLLEPLVKHRTLALSAIPTCTHVTSDSGTERCRIECRRWDRRASPISAAQLRRPSLLPVQLLLLLLLSVLIVLRLTVPARIEGRARYGLPIRTGR